MGTVPVKHCLSTEVDWTKKWRQ